MPDIATVWDVAAARGDWQLGGYDLVKGGDLETAVLISLFTDRTSDPDDVIPDGTTDPRGWWGDMDRDRPIGSKLWLRLRAKQTAQTLNLVADDIRQALQWLRDDGVASTVDVQCAWVAPGTLGAQITIQQPSAPPTVFNFGWVWGALQPNAPALAPGPFILGTSTLGGGNVI